MHVFTYGSLMFAPVWQQVVRGSYRSQRATLEHHRRHALADERYPGMVPAPQARVDGLVYFDVTDDDLARLDAFEGEQYRRVPVMLQLADAGIAADDRPVGLAAQTYVFTAVERLIDAAWDPAAFDLAGFIASYCHDKNGA